MSVELPATPGGGHHSLAEAVDDGIDESGSAPGDRPFRPDVQGLRALAVLLVVLFHAGVPGLQGGFVGVDVFFVISGFVITGLLLRQSAGGQPSLSDFWARRARRILPMATLVLVATVLASTLLLGRFVGQHVAVDGLWTAVFLANVHAISTGTNYFASTGPVSPLLHYWSLAVEEQFYVVFPLLVLVASLWRRWSLRRTLGVFLGVIIVMSLVLSGTETATSPVVAYFSPFTRAWELAAGGLVALGTARLARVPHPLAALLSWGGLGGILLSASLYGSTTPYPGTAVLLPVVSTCLVIAAGASAPALGAEILLGTRAGQVGGDLSYSLYLWHFPVLIIAAEAVTTPLSGMARAGLVVLAVILAAASKRWVEDPVRLSVWLAASARRSLVVGAGLVSCSLVACLVVVTLSQPTAGSVHGVPRSTSLPTLEHSVAAGVRTTAVPGDVVPPLGPPPPSLSGPLVPDRCWVEAASQTSISPCSFGDLTSTHTILLLGDSTAAMWSGAFVTLAREHHERLVLVAKTGCAPWLVRDLIFGGGPDPWCSAWHRFEVTEAARLRPSAIVVTGFLGVPAVPSSVPAGIVHLLAALRAVTPDVTLLSNLPAVPPGHADPATCVLVHPDHVTPCNLSVAAFEKAYGSFRAALVHGARSTGARYVNLDPLLCTSRWCPVVVAHHLVYRDLFHLNTAYVRYVARPLGDLLGSPVLSPPRA